MSQLDDALEQAVTEDPEGNFYISKSKAKNNVKALMLELLGDDQDVATAIRSGSYDLHRQALIRNELRGELRKKVEEL